MTKRWVLKLAESEPPTYLSDFRISPAAWTPDVGQAEPFLRAVDAFEMIRRLSHLMAVELEAVSVGGEPESDRDLPCITIGCRNPAAEDSYHCAEHKESTLLARWQIDEAVKYAVRNRLCQDLMGMDLTGDDFTAIEREVAGSFLLSPADLKRMRRQP